MGSPLPPFQKKLAHVYCGQTAGWIKIVVNMEVGLSPSDFMLDGDPASLSKKGAEKRGSEHGRIVKDCLSFFAIDLPSCVCKKRQEKFILQ